MKRIRWERIWGDPDGLIYQALNTVTYYSPRYNRHTTVTKGDKSDGATNAPNIDTDGWGHHDTLCSKRKWDDGTPVSNWQASAVLADILWRDGHKIRAFFWRWATFLFGGRGLSKAIRRGVDGRFNS